jgi:hypothetical protein
MVRLFHSMVRLLGLLIFKFMILARPITQSTHTHMCINILRPAYPGHSWSQLHLGHDRLGTGLPGQQCTIVLHANSVLRDICGRTQDPGTAALSGMHRCPHRTCNDP